MNVLSYPQSQSYQCSKENTRDMVCMRTQPHLFPIGIMAKIALNLTINVSNCENTLLIGISTHSSLQKRKGGEIYQVDIEAMVLLEFWTNNTNMSLSHQNWCKYTKPKTHRRCVPKRGGRQGGTRRSKFPRLVWSHLWADRFLSFWV